MKERKVIEREERRIPRHHTLTIDGPIVHHGTTPREEFVEAEVRELGRRRALQRAKEERRRMPQENQGTVTRP
jgi:hypothetical protein